MKRIIMIEDNEDHALLIRRGVETPECAVAHYADGIQALKALEQIKNSADRPDLILLDLQLPGMNGFDIMKAIKNISFIANVPVVMLTTSARPEEIEQAYQLGARGYLVKSDDFPVLMAKLKSVKDYWFSVVESPYRFQTPVVNP